MIRRPGSGQIGANAGEGEAHLARRLREHVGRLEGPRHPKIAPARHAAAARYVDQELRRYGYEVRIHAFRHGGREHRNVATVPTSAAPGDPTILVGAHYDTVAATPGADDNASGIAALLETARLLGRADAELPVQFVAFDLEEPHGGRYRLGSRAWVGEALERGASYRGALILEMVGYTDHRPGSQRVPWLLRWRDLPDRGTFLAAVGDWNSRGLLRSVEEAAHRDVPDLPLVTSRIPFRGWLVPQSRLSDNASFWDRGVPALMLTDTAFLRNPHYHGPGDESGTLDYRFMRRVVSLVTASVRTLTA